MKHKSNRRGVLLKSGIDRDTLISEYTSGISLKEIGRKYARTSERIWQIIRFGCQDHEYENLAKCHKENRKGIQLSRFMAFANELGRVPRLNEAKLHSRGLHTNYHEFRKAAEENGFVYAAGLYKRGRRRKYSADELLAYLKELAAALGHTPSCNDINGDGKFTHNMYVTCFGSLKKAQELAGLAPNEKYNSVENARRNADYITREHCLEDVKRIHDELGCPPSLAQLKEYGKYPFSKYYSRLGGIKKIRTLAELKQREVSQAIKDLPAQN